MRCAATRVHFPGVWKARKSVLSPPPPEAAKISNRESDGQHVDEIRETNTNHQENYPDSGQAGSWIMGMLKIKTCQGAAGCSCCQRPTSSVCFVVRYAAEDR